MTEKERFGYLTGLVDMPSYKEGLAVNRGRMNCIINNYYRRSDKKDDAWTNLYASLKNFPDKQPATIVILLAKKACGG